MSFDAKEMKERVLIVDVLMHYGIRLRRSMANEEYAYVACPLPTHPKDDRNNNCFNVHLPSNRWQCKHPTCARMNLLGNRWGDCINLVMVLDGLQFKQAGEKLQQWFPRSENPAPRIETREREKEQNRAPPAHTSEITSSTGEVKYTEKVRIWFEELSELREGETPEAYRKRVLRGVTSELLKNYQAGKAARPL